MMFKKKSFWIILLVIIALLGAFFYYNQTKNKDAANKYETGKVERGNIVSMINATGTINPVNYVDVSTNVNGELKSVLVRENEVVQKGQVIAYIDDTNLRDNVASLQAVLNNKRADYERYKQLYENGAVSAQTYENAKTAYLTSQADFNKANKSLSDATIVAPMAGTIVGAPLQPGQTISTGLSSQMIIATIADLSKLEIYLTIDETDIAGIKEGQKVKFTVDAFPGKEFEGTVSAVSRGTKGNLGSVSKSVVFYTVKVAIPEGEGKNLLPSMTARASIFGASVDNALLVPLAAIRSDKKGQFVYVMKDGKPQRQSVDVGITGDNYVEIKKGVEEGQEIVISGDTNNKAESKPRQGLF